MTKPSKSIRDLARRLLAAEAKARSAGDPHEAVLVFERLRVSMTRFAGAEGFSALTRRSLTIAREEVPALKKINVGAGGRIDGFAENGSDDGAAVLTVHLLWLLVTFIGEPMTMRLVHESWPDVDL